jgi:hypothetical protein
MIPFSRLFTLAAIACALLVSVSSVRAADVENPEYKSWSGFKVGTTATWHTTTSAAGNKTEMDRTVKLIELAADHAVVEEAMVMEVSGQKINTPAAKRTIPAKLAAGAAAPAVPAQGAAAKESEETLEIGGKSYKCKAIATSREANGAKTQSKVWTCADVPSTLVKMTSTSEGAFKSETTMTLVSIEAAK